jgi:hypothetical protein
VDAIESKKLVEIYQQRIGYLTGAEVQAPQLSETVQHLARTAAKLSDRDREEPLCFAWFLQTRKRR